MGCSADCWLSSSRPRIRLHVEVDRRCCCWWWLITIACILYAVRAKVLSVGHPTVEDWRTGILASLSSAMCQHCKLVTAHGRRQASPPFHALFPFLVQMLKRWIRTIRAPPSQIANRARPFPSAWKPFPTVPREWTESKVHSPRDFRGSRGIAAKMSFSTVQLEYAVDDTT